MNQSINKWLLLLPAVLALLVNLNVLQNGFVWDDHFILLGSEGSPFDPGMVQAYQGTYHRPVVGWLYWIDKKLWGIDPFGFHFTNLLLHFGSTLLVTLLAFRLFETRPDRNRLCMLTGSLFAVHPVHTEAIAWIPGRTDLLAAFFLLLSFWIYLEMRRRRRPWLLFPIWAVSLALALLSKESAFPFILIFPLYDLLCRHTDKGRAMKPMILSTFTLGVVAIVYLGIRYEKFGSPIGSANLYDWPLIEQLKAIFLSIGFYIKHLFFPFPQNAFILFPDSFGIREFSYLILGVTTIGLLIVSTVSRRSRFLSLGFWAIVLGLAMPSIVPLFKATHAPVAERYLYIPSIGFSFILAFLLIGMGRLIRKRLPSIHAARVNPLGVTLLIIVSSISTISRNSVWQDDEHLWADTVIKSPNAAMPHNFLGLVYNHQGRLAEAKREFILATTSAGNDRMIALATNNLGGIYMSEGRFDQAEAAFRSSIESRPEFPLAHYNLGVLYWKRFEKIPPSGSISSEASPGNDLLVKARRNLIQAVVHNPGYSQAYYLLGRVNLALSRDRKAKENFKKVVHLDPTSEIGKDAARRLAEMR